MSEVEILMWLFGIPLAVMLWVLIAMMFYGLFYGFYIIIKDKGDDDL